MEYPSTGLIDRMVTFSDDHAFIRGVILADHISKDISLDRDELPFFDTFCQVGKNP